MNHALASLCALATALAASDASAVQYFSAPTNLGNASDWTNYLHVVDLNGDGSLDVIVPSCGGFFSPPQAQPLRVYLNNGSGSLTDSTASVLGAAVTAPIRVVAVGDIDGDGDLDIYAPSAGAQPDKLYVNAGGGVYTDMASTQLPAGTNSRSGGARFGDLDGDGDLDLIVAQGYDGPQNPIATLLINDGTGVFSDASAMLPATITGVEPDDVDLLDVDRDFDLDILINAHAGSSALWLNDGAGSFTAAPAFPVAMNGFHYGPSACDVDGDGDLDLWFDNIGPQMTEVLLLNNGDGSFTNGTNQVSNNPSADDNGVMCVDVDDDGDFDAIIPSLSGNERILINDGNGNFVGSNDGFPSVGDPTLWIDFGDLDGDGRLDAVTGQGEGNPEQNLIYVGHPNQPVDATPPKIIAVEPVADTFPTNTPVAVRYAVSDRAVGDSGPQLDRAFARVTVDGVASEVDARFMGGDLFRVVVPAQSAMGAVVSVTVCATDRQDNEGCATAFTYTIDGMGPSTGGGGPAGGGEPVGGGSASGGNGQGGSFDPGGDEGCGCTTPGGRNSDLAWLALLGLGGLALRRRRRS